LLDRGNIAIVLPALNEEEGIGPTLDEYMKTVPARKVIVVDGGSSDRTAQIAREMGAEVLTGVGGKGAAISEALKYIAGLERIDYVVFADADYTYPATKVPEMIGILDSEPEVGAVLGDRFNGKNLRASLSDIYSAGNLLIRQLYKTLKGICLNDPLSGLRVVRRCAISGWLPKSRGFEVETEMNLYLINNGWLIKEVPIVYRNRLGKKKLKIHDAIPIIRTLITYDGRR